MIRIRARVGCVEQGVKIASLSVIGPAFSSGGGKWRVVVRCDCGAVKTVFCGDLSRGKSDACHRCASIARNTTHGDAAGHHRRLYRIWCNLRRRCTDPKFARFEDYGGRGIGVCIEWMTSYQSFKAWAIANGYADDKQIDRHPDNNGDYEPGNCRWTTAKQNMRNTRRNKMVAAFGEVKCISEWSEDIRCAVSSRLLSSRLLKNWEPESAIATPPLK